MWPTSTPGPRVSGSRSIRYLKKASHGNYSIPSLLADCKTLRLSPRAMNNSSPPKSNNQNNYTTNGPSKSINNSSSSSPKAVERNSPPPPFPSKPVNSPPSPFLRPGSNNSSLAGSDLEGVQYIKTRFRQDWLFLGLSSNIEIDIVSRSFMDVCWCTVHTYSTSCNSFLTIEHFGED